MRRFLCAGMLVALMATFVQASILDGFVRNGAPGAGVTNTVEDSNAEVIVKVGADLTKFEVGDMVDIYLDMVTINSSDGFFFNTPLDAATAGGAGYHLIGKGTLTVSAINNIVINGIGDTEGDFSFTGSIDFFESAVEIDFTQGIAAADVVIAAAAPSIFSIGIGDANDFITALSAPIEFANIPTSGTAVNADFGLSLVGGGINGLVPDAIADVNGVLQDFVGSTQAFADPGLPSGGLGDDKFDLRTNTDFSWVGEVPEPTSVLVWGGLIALLGAWRFRRDS